MAGTTYIVSIDLQTKGNLTPGIDKTGNAAKVAGAAVNKLSTGFDKASAGVGRLFGVFDGVVSRVADVTIGMAKWGVIGAAGAVTYGVVHLNNELEQTKIALGAIFQANGIAADLPTGMKIAQETIAKMRVDAQKLPGEFSDLRNIFTTAAIPGFQAGASVDQMREMSGKLMAFAKVAQMPMDQAARESAQLLEGRAGAHNVLGMKLAALAGDSAQAFNKQDSGKRFADVNKYLDKYKDSIEEFGKSWEGISSTTVDMGKQWITLATAPVFDKAKGSLEKINSWFMENRDYVNSWSTYIGDKLSDAYDVAIVKMQEWWPAIKQFASNAFDRLRSVWDDIAPSVEKFGNALQTALKDPGTLDKLVHLAEIWAGGKVVGSAVSTVASVGQVAVGGAMVAKHMGWIGGAAGAAGGTAAAAGAEGAAGAALFGGTGGFLVELAIVAAPAIAALSALAIAAYAAAEIHTEVAAYQKQDGDARLEAANAIVNGTRSMAENVSTFNSVYSDYVAANNELMVSTIDAAAAVSGMAAAMDGYKIERNKDIGDKGNDWLRLMGIEQVNQSRAETKKPTPHHPGGGGGTHIAKIEITVSGNDEPNRVAALVLDKFNKQARHRRTSPDVPSFSRGG